jgi:ATP-dependent Lhr-like helicase
MFGVEGAADLLRLLGPLTVEEVAARWSPTRSSATSTPQAEPQPPADPVPLVEPVETSPTGDLETSPTEAIENSAAQTSSNELLPTPSPTDVSAARSALDELVATKRALRASIAGSEHFAAIEDAARLRDALGVPLPIGVPTAFIEPVADPLGDLVGRYARTHGPFTVTDVASRFGLGAAVAHDALRRVSQDRRITEGEFRPTASGTEWCDAEVLRRIRRLSLAALRHEVEPVEPKTFARFLPDWQHVGGTLRGVDAVASVIEQLAGTRIPASAWESLILPSRVSDYQPAMLDELTASGEVLWSGSGSLPGNDGWVSLHLADTAPLTMSPPPEHATDELQREVLSALGAGGAFFFRQLSDAVGSLDDAALTTALWDLVWAGLITNDTFAPLRALTGGRGAHKPQRATPRGRAHVPRAYGRPAASFRPAPVRSGPPTTAGRWSILPLAETDATVRAKAVAENLLDRYGVVTRGSVMAENQPGGFALAYRVLSGFEESGRARRGYFVETLGAAQFATSATVDRLRTFTLDSTLEAPRLAVALAATDPANPYGAALPWPQASAAGGALSTTGHRPGRKAGGIVVLVDGALVLYVERGGKTTLLFDRDDEVVLPAARALADAIRRGRISTLTIETVGGEFVLGTPFGEALIAAGFGATPRGLRLRS